MLNTWIKEKDAKLPTIKKRRLSKEWSVSIGSSSSRSSILRSIFAGVDTAASSEPLSEIELHVAKSKLMDALYGIGNMAEFAKVALSFSLREAGGIMGGFYINTSMQNPNWVLCCSLPDTQSFTASFQLTNLISQASHQRNSFIVDSSDTSLSFLFTPIVTHDSENATASGLVVLGVSVTQENKRNKIELMNELAKVIASHLRLAQLQLSRFSVQKKIDQLMEERKGLQRTALICTSATGTITHFSDAASRLLGYLPKNMVGTQTNIMDIHLPEELEEKAKHLSKKMRRKISGFQVLTVHALKGEIETSQWKYIKSDSTFLALHCCVEPLIDNGQAVVGFAFTLQPLPHFPEDTTRPQRTT